MFEQWSAVQLPHSLALIRWFAADQRFDLVESLDAIQRFLCQRRLVCRVELVELAPGMRPACRLAHSSLNVQAVEAAEGVSLQRAAEAHQMRARMRPLARCRVAIERGRWIGAARGSVIPHVYP